MARHPTNELNGIDQRGKPHRQTGLASKGRKVPEKFLDKRCNEKGGLYQGQALRPRGATSTHLSSFSKNRRCKIAGLRNNNKLDRYPELIAKELFHLDRCIVSIIYNNIFVNKHLTRVSDRRRSLLSIIKCWSTGMK